MDLLNLFAGEGPVAGLEISDSYIRIILLEIVDKKKLEIKIKAFSQESLPKKTVTGGVIKNRTLFKNALEKLILKTGLDIEYAIVSLSGDNIYSKLFSFPSSVSKERLEETMKLTSGFQLPVKPEDVYIDWEKVESLKSDQNMVLLSAIPRGIVNKYLEVLSEVGVKTIAVEHHSLSFARVIKSKETETILIKQTNAENMVVSIIKNRIVRFLRVLPLRRFTDKELETELESIKNFYDTEYEPINRIVEFGDLQVRERFSSILGQEKDQDKWLIPFGAAVRGLMPRKEDNLISLLPVGTEDAYEYQKAITFSEFTTSVLVGVSIFFSAAFVGIWGMMLTFEEKASNGVSNISPSPIIEEAISLEEKAKELNNLLSQATTILKESPHWSKVIGEIRGRIINGTTISSVNLSSVEGVLDVKGAAKSRETLNLFKESIESSGYFTEVTLPLTNLGQKNDIPFSISFKLKDSSIIYEL